ncbi:MAG: response regulator [Planctomycetales bacterium]|nr:response regulator [Planctomycetales bacterium]
MNSSLRIAVADDEPDMRDYFQRILPRLGHCVVGAAEDGMRLVELCREAKPDLVFTDIRMPRMDGIQAAIAIYAERPVPIILVSAHHDSELIARAEADHVLAYLVKPIRQADLPPAIGIAMRRFEQFREVEREAADLREAIEHRRTVEQAKQSLMRETGADEPDAFARLRDLAIKRQQKLIEAARNILQSEKSG